MKITTLKIIISIILLGGKFTIIGLLFFHFSTFGITSDELWAGISIIAPLFTIYTSIIVKSWFASPFKTNEQNKKQIKKVKGFTSLLSIFFAILYLFVIWLIINQTAKGGFDLAGLQKALGLVEALLGVYIAIVVDTFFKLDKNNTVNT